MSNGIGFNLKLLFGWNDDAPGDVAAASGKTIKSIALAAGESDKSTGMAFLFADDTAVIFYDDARSCCEHRYMTTDDDLATFVGATFYDVALSENNTPDGKGQSEWVDYEQHEWCFVDFTTSMGVFTSTMHDRHNGYYGGIALAARVITADEFRKLAPHVKNN